MNELLNEDLSGLENVTPFLKQCLGKGKEIPPGSILQIQQITNVSSPTYDRPNYESDKHTLKLAITDGHSQAYALIPDNCPGISLTTAPGTKLRSTQAIPVQGSLFILTRNNCEVLGGKVIKLFEKWEKEKRMAIKHEWGYTGSMIDGEGPPTWKPFGYKTSIDVAALRKMKTIDVVQEDKDKSGGVKTQFDLQRDEAISELQNATLNKQKFQKPNKHLLDKEITDLMDEGFTQTEADYAMKRFKNPQKALKFLKESKKRVEGGPKEPPKPFVDRRDRRRKGKGMDDDDDQDVPAEYQRPTKSISLFGFIEGQFKTIDKATPPNGPTARTQDGKTRDLEDSMGRMGMKESRSEPFFNSRDNGRGRGYRGGNHGHRDRDRDRDNDSYQSNRYDSSKNTKSEAHQRPPRFQNRGGFDSRPSNEFHSGPQRTQSNTYDNYRGQTRDSFDTGVKEASRSYNDNSTQRQDYSANYYSQRQVSSSGKERSTSDYYQQQQGNRGKDRSTDFYQQGQSGKDRSSSDYYQQGTTGKDRSSDIYQQGNAGKDRSTDIYQQGNVGKDRSSDFYQQGNAGKDRSSDFYQQGNAGKDRSSSDFYQQAQSGKEPSASEYFQQQQQGHSAKERSSSDYYQQQASSGKERFSVDYFHHQGQSSKERSSTDFYQQQDSSGKQGSSSDYYQKQYSNDYPAPSHKQSYPQQQQQQQNYHSQVQQQTRSGQYMSGGSQSEEQVSRHGGDQQRQQSHYSNHSTGNNPPQTHSEFSHYQYGYDEWNPAQSLVFTRSKPDARGRGGGGNGSYRGASGRGGAYNSATDRPYQSSRY